MEVASNGARPSVDVRSRSVPTFIPATRMKGLVFRSFRSLIPECRSLQRVLEPDQVWAPRVNGLRQLSRDVKYPQLGDTKVPALGLTEVQPVGNKSS